MGPEVEGEVVAGEVAPPGRRLLPLRAALADAYGRAVPTWAVDRDEAAPCLYRSEHGRSGQLCPRHEAQNRSRQAAVAGDPKECRPSSESVRVSPVTACLDMV